MYLKRIEMHGFKSFADRSVIEFQPGITGIVGPNGCGKSNINDAIRWVLGEQSAKSLRGSHMSDVIFNGSEGRKAQSLAEVTLVFDNQDHYIHSEYNEIEITRRLYRDGNDAEYLLNRQQCRLKDIIDLMMDTGLGRDSLSIISQGNISTFADAKPEERRSTFEEAAGVAKYKKRKDESLRKLERTTENLDRVEDIVYELEKQLNPLRRQKEKAEQYLNYRQSLQDVEISLIVHEVKALRNQADALKKEITDLQIEETTQKNNEILLNQKSDTARSKMLALDHEVDQLQEKLMKAMEQVSVLNAKKTEMEAKRQYALSQSDEDMASKIENLKYVLQDAIQEYNDRVERFDKANEEVSALLREKNQLNEQVIKTREAIDRKSSELQMHRARKTQLVDNIENHSGYPAGVRAIVSAKMSIAGYQGVLEELLEVKDGYEQAVMTALGGARQYIIMKDDASARSAIAYLKNNKAGRATFLPMSTMKARFVKQDALTVLEGTSGYLGVATDFIICQAKYKEVMASQLGNVLVAENLEAANQISHYTYNRYKVVTLDGDVVNVGGSMTGGAYRQSQNQSLASQKKELENLQLGLTTCESELIELRQKANRIDNELMELNNNLLQKQIARGKLEEIVRSKLSKVNVAKSEYESMSHEKLAMDDLKSDEGTNVLIKELNQARATVDELTAAIQTQRQLRMQYVTENENYESELRQIRSQVQYISKQLAEKQVQATRLESQMGTSLQRLNEEYQMTFETALEHAKEDIDFSNAREEVLRLRTEIQALGNVNLDAIKEYEDVSSRYENLNAQRLDLKQAQDTILKAIQEMDQVMTEQFDTTFKKINEEFNLVFRRLFGGGKAELRYSDPDNILETGIDIEVQPPGKKVQNISLFSGGEKALIALSGLFAILRARPVPMCLLDEVEAALDQANVERFAKFLKDFSEKTQFIVVTHRPGTMEQCDALYGATMQESGVTRLVSVQLQDAMEMAE